MLSAVNSSRAKITMTFKAGGINHAPGFIAAVSDEKRNDACANCHKVYRDKGGTEGSGPLRCQPSPEEK